LNTFKICCFLSLLSTSFWDMGLFLYVCYLPHSDCNCSSFSSSSRSVCIICFGVAV